MAALKLYLFGTPRLERDGVDVKIPRRKALALLAYLVATGTPHARDMLAALFWPDHSQSAARLALSRHLSELNRVLPAGTPLLEPDRVAAGRSLWVDVREFVAVADAALAPVSLPALQAAAGLYTADFLAGFTLPDSPGFDDWQAYATKHLRRSAHSLLEKLAGAYAAAGDSERAIATAHGRLALDPLDEDAHRALMLLYAQAGQPGAALRQYEQCRQILEDEQGAPPAAETVELYEQIRRGEMGQVNSQLTIDNSPLTIPRLPTQATRSSAASLNWQR